MSEQLRCAECGAFVAEGAGCASCACSYCEARRAMGWACSGCPWRDVDPEVAAMSNEDSLWRLPQGVREQAPGVVAFQGEALTATAQFDGDGRPIPRRPVSLMVDALGRPRCCICFEAFDTDDLYVDLDGQRWDVCVRCAVTERWTDKTWPG